ncbi:MAG: hypothetical protein RLZZ127_2623 [Planctomycetota bacterium]
MLLAALAIAGCAGGRTAPDRWEIAVIMRQWQARSFSTPIAVHEPAWPVGTPLFLDQHGHRLRILIAPDGRGGHLVLLRHLPPAYAGLPIDGPLPDPVPFAVTDRVWDLPAGTGITLSSARADLRIMPRIP